MKTDLQIHDPKSQDFDETQNIVDTGHVKGLALATHDGATNKLTGSPKISGMTLELLTGAIHAHYNHLLTTINSILDAALQIQLGASEKVKIEEENQKLTMELQKEEKEYEYLKHLVTDKDSKHAMFSFGLGLLVLLSVFLTEWIYMSRSLQLIAPNFLSALLMGLGISVSIAVIGWLGAMFINTRIKLQIMRWIARFILSSIITCAFVGLAIMRNKFLEAQGKPTVPIWVFVGINIFLFITIFLITELWLIPLWNKAKEAYKARQAKRKADKKLSRITQLRNQITNNLEHLSSFLKERLKIVYRHINREKEIDKRYKEAVQVYIQSAMCINPDGSMPSCFKEQPKELDFFTTDILKNINP